MIADASVTMGSPWMSEGPSDDLMSDGFDLDLDLDIGAFEAEISRIHRQPMSESQNDMYAFLNCVSRDTSVAGSECSDDLCVDFDGDEALFCDLQASILNIVDDNSDSNILSLDNIELADGDWNLPRSSRDFDNQSVTSDYSSSSSSSSKSSCCTSSKSSSCSSSSSMKNSPKNCVKTPSKSPSKSKQHKDTSTNKNSSPQMGRKRQNSQSTDGKKWSHLSSNEQVSVVEELSHIISSEMGLREQLEVIRIINPNAKVSPTDREFVIDLEAIDDNKLQKIQEYVKIHASCPSLESSPESLNVSQKKSTKRQKCQDRRNQQKVIRQRQRKEYRQMMKERRSGLFVKEEVMALSVSDPGEEDIDILM